MKKIKYYYNSNTLRYEKLVTPLRVKILRVFGFVAASLVTAAFISYLAFQFIGSPKEKLLAVENERLTFKFQEINEKVVDLQLQMSELEKRDNDVYRAIFEAKPIPDSAREKSIEKKKDAAKVDRMNDQEIINSIEKSLNVLTNRLQIQNKSFNEIKNLLNNKEELLASTPAIQPVSNKNLDRIASGFGYRIDPIYKTVKLHAGLDFTATTGTPIYATAKGTVKVAGYHVGGYGNHVVINHGYGYETLYGHMARIKVRVGQQIKRGEVIGYVGSTGKSTGPHCHYEVHKYGQKIDPIYFFYNDLSPEQFDRLLKKAAASNQSLD